MQAKVDYEDLLMQRHMESATQAKEVASVSGSKELEEALRAVVDLREEYT